jgi:glutathionylspermidine synthase
VAPSFKTPPWVARTVLLLLVIGFPVALLFAWIGDLDDQPINVLFKVYRRNGGLTNSANIFSGASPRRSRLRGRSHCRTRRRWREGANIRVLDSGRVVAETYGGYGTEGFVYQAHVAMPAFDGNYPVIGSWVIASQASGTETQHRLPAIAAAPFCSPLNNSFQDRSAAKRTS